MRIIGQEESPQSAEDTEVFNGLHLVGTPGRVHVVVNERKLSIEQKSGHSTVLSHDWVMRMNHTKKPFVPNGYAVLGLVMLWIGYRGMVFGTTSQLITVGVGLLCIIGRFGIKRPMLIIETKAHDCHMMTGNDAVLMRLCELHSRLTDGMSLEQARLGLDQLQRDVDFPRSQAQRLIPVEPVHIESPLAIAALITNHGDEEANAMIRAPLNFHGNEEPLDLDFGEPETEGWMFGEQEPMLPNLDLNHGLIERGRANARTRRGVHGVDAHLTEPRYNHHPSHPYPAAQPADVSRSFGQIKEANSELSHRQSVGTPSQAPSEFLPSFFGPEGAHVPQQNPSAPQPAVEIVPSLLPFEEELDALSSEHPQSLVSTARVDEPLEAELVQEPQPTAPQSKTNRYTMRPRESSFSHPRWIRRSSAQGGSSRVRSFFDGINRNAAIAGKFLTGTQSSSSSPAGETETGHELRERSANTLQDEIINSVSNLSELNGGSLPPEEAERLQSHITRRSSIVEQIYQERQEQEKALNLEELSFEELTESVEKHKATAGVSGLPRLDL